MQPRYGRQIVQTHLEFFGERIEPFDTESTLHVLIGTSKASFGLTFKQQQFFVHIDEITTQFRMKSCAAVSPLTYELWQFQGDVLYIGDAEHIDTVYQLMCLVKSYNRRARYALYDTKTRKYVVEPATYKTPFNPRGTMPTRDVDIEHLQSIELMLADLKTRTTTDPVEGYWYRNNVNMDVYTLLLCWFDCHVTSIGDLRLQYSTNPEFRRVVQDTLSA